mgnify:CR=1 FL=1
MLAEYQEVQKESEFVRFEVREFLKQELGGTWKCALSFLLRDKLSYIKPTIHYKKVYLCIRKSYPNKQSDADYGNWNGYQVITQKQGNSSNSLDFNEVYSLYRFTEKMLYIFLL